MPKKKPGKIAESPAAYAVVANRTSTSTKNTERPIRYEQSDARIARIVEVIGKESVSSFSRRCGVPESVLRSYINDGREPPFGNAVAIADAGGVTLDWLGTGRLPKARTDLRALQEAESGLMAPQINAKALGMILGGILRGMEGSPDHIKAAMTAVQYYQDALAAGLITSDGVGDSGKSAA